MDWFKDLLVALGVVLNGIPQGLLALSYGFASVPTAIGFAIGGIGCIALGSVASISFQAETIALAGTMGRDRRERLSMVLYAGVLMALLGLTGVLNAIVDFAGTNIINGMMAGVGIMLARVAFDMCKSNKAVGWTSVGVALAVYFLTKDLVYTIIASVVLSSALGLYLARGKGKTETSVPEGFEDKIKLIRPVVNVNVIRGALALACLTIGANIAFGSITGGIAGQAANIDHLTIYSGLADAGSALFGGGPVEAIISATASAPHAVWAGVIMMAIMALILVFRLLPKIGRYVASQSIAGFLLVLGAVVTVPTNAAGAFDASQPGGILAGGVALTVTAIADPFFGLLAGIVVKLIAGPLGL